MGMRSISLWTAIVLTGFLPLSAQALPQRGFPAPPGLSGLLGSFQPEPIRSILLLNSGRSLPKAEVDKFEADLRSTPDNIDARLNLIGYYSWNGKTPADFLRLRVHVLWMIENHPENPATGEPSLIDLPDDPEGSARILELWNTNLQLHGAD